MRKTFKSFVRCISVYEVFWDAGFDELSASVLKYRLLRFVSYIYFYSKKKFLSFFYTQPILSRGEKLRYGLEHLGPVFVKFGQLLSTRHDWIPQDILDSLSQLQDNVQPFLDEQVKSVIENTYGKSIHDCFQSFDLAAFASASIAQVHRAQLFTGEQVVVKILRPNIQHSIKEDIALLYVLAKIAQWHPILKKLDPIAIVVEFERCLLNELNLLQEAANASQIKRNSKQLPYIKIPSIYWEYTHRNVLVMEYLYGNSIKKHACLSQENVDFKKLANHLLETFFTQAFQDRFFHADLHPGNILIHTVASTVSFGLVDFGIVGTLTVQDRRYLAENLLAFLNQNYQKVALLHVKSGWVPKDTSLDDFTTAIRLIGEPIFDRSLYKISISQVLSNLFQTANKFHMKLQPQLLLLQKTLFNVESISRQLDPKIDLWEAIRPFLNRWLQLQISSKYIFQELQRSLPMLLEKLPELSDLLNTKSDVENNQFLRAPVIIQNFSKKSQLFKSYLLRISGILLLLLPFTSMISKHIGPFLLVIHPDIFFIVFKIMGCILILIS